jgi:hypothetical protein
VYILHFKQFVRQIKVSDKSAGSLAPAQWDCAQESQLREPEDSLVSLVPYHSLDINFQNERPGYSRYSRQIHRPKGAKGQTVSPNNYSI